MEDTLPKKAYKVKKRRVKSTEEIIIMADKQLAAVIRKKMLKKQREEAKKIPCSTPISKKMPKGLLLNISAIDAEPQNNSTILYNDVERGPDRSKLHNLNTLFLSETVIGKENLSGNSPEETVFSKPNAMNSVKASGETSNKAKSWRVSRKKTTFIEEEPNSSLIPANDDISNNEEKDSQTSKILIFLNVFYLLNNLICRNSNI